MKTLTFEVTGLQRKDAISRTVTSRQLVERPNTKGESGMVPEGQQFLFEADIDECPAIGDTFEITPVF